MSDSEHRDVEPINRIVWYVDCLKDTRDGKVVRGLAEAEAGFASALTEFAALLARLEQVEQERDALETELARVRKGSLLLTFAPDTAEERE